MAYYDYEDNGQEGQDGERNQTPRQDPRYGPYGAPPSGSQWAGSTYQYQPGGPPPPWEAPQNWTAPQTPSNTQSGQQASPWDRGAFMDRWGGQVGQRVDNLQGWLDQNQDVGKGVKVGHNGEWFELPDGERFDAIQDFGGANVARNGSEKDWATAVLGLSNEEAAIYARDPQAYARSHPQYARQILGDQGAAGGSPTPGTGGPLTPSGGGPSGNSAMMDELLKTLLDRSKQSLAVNRMDPTIRAQADPYAATQEKARRDYLADTAEKAGPRANLQGEARLASERAGQASGLFESQLIGRELGDRRTEIQNALTQMGTLLTSQQQMALQKELTLIDDATRRLGISTQNDQFKQNLGFQVDDRSSYWDALRSGLFNN